MTHISRRHFVQGASALAMAAMVVPKAFGQDPGKTLVIASPATPQGLDLETDISLGSIDSQAALYDKLVTFKKIPDPDNAEVQREDIQVHAEEPNGMALEGALAESWEVSPDGRKIVFNLRGGVTSNWGNQLSAEDVKYSWLRKLNANGSGTFFTTTLGITSEEQIKIEGPLAVSFNLDKPSPLILKLHTNHQTGIVDSVKMQEMATTDDPWALNFLKSESAGYGPYRVQQIVRGQQAVFTRREDYWGDAPFFDAVVMREVPSSASRLSLLQGGAVDIAQFLSPREANSLSGAPGVTVDAVNSSYSLWVQLNAKMAPFDNVDVRRAMNYLVPRQELVDTVFYGMASGQTAFMPETYPMVDAELFVFDEDVEAAKQALADAGMPNGFEMTLSYDAGSPVQESMALIYQTSLRRVGIEATLEKLPAGVFYDAIAKRTKAAIFYLDAPWTPDPGYATALYFTTPSFVNYSNYSNARVDELIAAGRLEVDDAKRYEIFHEVQEILMAEAPWALAVYPKYLFARKSNVKGFTYYTSNSLKFQDLSRA